MVRKFFNNGPANIHPPSADWHGEQTQNHPIRALKGRFCYCSCQVVAQIT
jgi:hypothetical protein